MTYRITGLPRASFTRYFSMSDAELGKVGARRLIADADRGFPCRVSLVDAQQGEPVLLINFESNSAPNPYRTAHAIYVREEARDCAPLVDRLPDVFEGRTLSLRGFDIEDELVGAELAAPGEVEAAIAALFRMPQVACIHAHNAAYGCFAALIERDGDVR